MNVVTANPGNVDKLDNGFRLHGGGGVYLAESTADIGTDPFMYWQTNLADNVWSYDIDVSNVGCKCNAAMYWVNMPGKCTVLYCTGSTYIASVIDIYFSVFRLRGRSSLSCRVGGLLLRR